MAQSNQHLIAPDSLRESLKQYGLDFLVRNSGVNDPRQLDVWEVDLNGHPTWDSVSEIAMMTDGTLMNRHFVALITCGDSSRSRIVIDGRTFCVVKCGDLGRAITGLESLINLLEGITSDRFSPTMEGDVNITSCYCTSMEDHCGCART